MEWSDEAIVLAARSHGDSSVVLEIFTRAHGRRLGLVRGGRSRALQPILQPGNAITATWRARLPEHLGQFAVEPARLRAAAFIGAPEPLFALQLLLGHIHLLPEHEPHAGLFDVLDAALDFLGGSSSPPGIDEICTFVARFELALLDEIGFGLDLASCVRTGARENLVFVSPRSGRAVSREGAAGYEARLLALPPFLLGDSTSNRSPADIEQGLRLTAHFLRRDLYEPHTRTMPAARDVLIDRLMGRNRPAA